MVAQGEARVVVTGGFEYAAVIESAAKVGEDRAAVIPCGDRLVIVLADGAGGTGSGGNAAQAVIDAIVEDPDRSSDPVLALIDLDDPRRLGGGQATAVITTIGPERVGGASVGDSGAWIITRDDIVDLTAGQVRKPLVGSGCTPIAFEASFERDATLLVASDGLFGYAKRADIARIAREGTVENAARALVALVRLASGGLQDDISIVLCRRGIRIE